MKSMRPIACLTAFALAHAALAAPIDNNEKQNAVNALWLLPYDIPTSEHANVMQQHRERIKWLPEDENDTSDPLSAQFARDTGQDLGNICSGMSVNECAIIVREGLPEANKLLANHQKLLQRIDALADYTTLHDSDFANRTDLHMLNVRFPEYAPLIKPPLAAAIINWQNGQAATAIRQACRNVQTGKLLINSNMGLISAMVGNSMVSQNLQLIAHIDAATPNLPDSAECRTTLAPLPVASRTLCHVFQAEHTLQQRAIATLKPQEIEAQQNEQNQSNALQKLACSSEFAQKVANDQKATLPTANDEATQYLTQQYADYLNRMQDLNLKIHALAAAFKINRLPDNQRTAAQIETILRQHSSANRRLRLHKQHIVFDAHSNKTHIAEPLPIRTIAP